MTVVLSLVAISGTLLLAQSDPVEEMPVDVMLLVQSELDYLKAAQREIDVELDGATPTEALSRIGEKAGLTIKVHGKPPRELKLTRSFEGATLKEVLTWYAREVPVAYRAEGPEKLTVVFREGRSS
jgi:hypothetical protein